jgi:hypothetical protein
MTPIMAKAKETIAQVLSPADALIQEWTRRRAELVDKQTAKRREIAAAQEEVDRLDEPRRRLERLQRELDFGFADEQMAIMNLQVQLIARQEILEFEEWLNKRFEALRLLAPPSAIETINQISGERKVEGLDEIEKRSTLSRALCATRNVVRDMYFTLDTASLRQRIAADRLQIERLIRDAGLRKELL